MYAYCLDNIYLIGREIDMIMFSGTEDTEEAQVERDVEDALLLPFEGKFSLRILDEYITFFKGAYDDLNLG